MSKLCTVDVSPVLCFSAQCAVCVSPVLFLHYCQPSVPCVLVLIVSPLLPVQCVMC